jgi:hypothetical protein
MLDHAADTGGGPAPVRVDEHLDAFGLRRRGRHRRAAARLQETCDTRPTCQSWAKMRPPAACTASVTVRQPATCAGAWMPGVHA